MRILLVHPSSLMYSEIYLRLEPIGLERVASAARAAGHDVGLLDLQIFRHRNYYRELETFKPEALGFSLNYLANVPEVLELAVGAKRLLPDCFVFMGGHSASFIAPEILDHARGTIDCVVRGEGEAITPQLLQAVGDRRLEMLPGIVTPNGAGPAPTLLDSLDRYLPPGTSPGAAGGISSGFWTPARRSSSRAAARGYLERSIKGRVREA